MDPTVPKKSWSPTQTVADHPSIAGIIILVLVILVIYQFGQGRGWFDGFVGGSSSESSSPSSTSGGGRRTKAAPSRKGGGKRTKEDEDVEELIDIINS